MGFPPLSVQVCWNWHREEGTVHRPHGAREAKSLLHCLGFGGRRLLSKEPARLSAPIWEASSEFVGDHRSCFGIPDPLACPLVWLALATPLRASEPRREASAQSCPSGCPPGCGRQAGTRRHMDFTGIFHLLKRRGDRIQPVGPKPRNAGA